MLNVPISVHRANIPMLLALIQKINAKLARKKDMFAQKVRQTKMINVPKEHMPMLQVSLNAKSAQKDITNLN